MKKPSIYLWFALVFLSGFSALIYQVCWHKYLAILVGSHAKATSIVLAVFLGAMGAGYYAFGKRSARVSSPLKLFAKIEFLLAAFAFSFPLFFEIGTGVTSSLFQVFGLANFGIDLLAAVALMGVPSFLLGASLPLLTVGVSSEERSVAWVHARLYGFNTLGAAAGSLVTGYFLIRGLGLSGSLFFAGAMNIFVGACSFLLARNEKEPSSSSETSVPHTVSSQQKGILGVALLSGFYVLTFESLMVRIIGQSVGATSHVFSLVVGVIILALGGGAVFVRKIETLSLRHLFWVQLVISVSLFGVYLIGDSIPYLAYLIRTSVSATPAGFASFQFFLAAFVIAVLFLPVALCGLTLPLCFKLFDSQEKGNRVGLLYGVNTLGTVLGCVFGGYLFYYFFNIEGIFRIAILVALASCYWAHTLYQKPPHFFYAAFVAVVLFVPNYNPVMFLGASAEQASSLRGKSWKSFGDLGDYKVTYQNDGPNSSVAIVDNPAINAKIVFLNGKNDSNTRVDRFTVDMLAYYPALLAPRTERALVIGFGTGRTIGALLQSPEVEAVDVLEISPALMKGAFHFDESNYEVSRSSRVSVHEMDAFRFFHGYSGEPYDIIVSEPSNPRVAGVENLYSSQFYEKSKRAMAQDGLFVQWLHTYNMSKDSIQLVLRTMQNAFSNLSVFQLGGLDIAILASQNPLGEAALKRAEDRLKKHSSLKNVLSELGVSHVESVAALELASPNVVREMLGEGDALVDVFQPALEWESAKYFFLRQSLVFSGWRREFAPFFQSNDALFSYINKPSQESLEEMFDTHCVRRVSRNNSLCWELLVASDLESPKAKQLYERTLSEKERKIHRGITSLAPKDPSERKARKRFLKRFVSPLNRKSVPTEALKELTFQ